MSNDDQHPEVGHLDLDALADVLAGDQSPEHATHLSTCASCPAALEALSAALDRVGADLAALPTPTLPADVIDRLDTALAAERDLAAERPDRVATTASPVPTASTARAVTTVTPIGSRADRRTRWWGAASGVAAAAAIVVGAIVLLPGDRNDSSTSDTSALREQALLPRSSTGSDYGRDGTLLKAQLPALLTGQADAKIGAPAGGAEPQATDTSTVQSAPQTADAPGLDRLRDPAALAACLTALTEDDESSFPLALDYAAFEGKPALVVVLPTSKPGKVDVFVVGAGCTQADEELLFFLRVDKP